MNRKKRVSVNSVSKKILALTLTLTLALPLPLAHSQELPFKVKRITDGSSMDFNPEFSLDGKQIVFINKIDNDERVKKGEFWHKSPFYLHLWIMDSDGMNRRQLTSGNVQDFAPRFTPDGKRIMFVSNRRDNSWDIWSIDADGSNLHRISEIEGDTGQWRTSHYPYPTPDGKGMVFILYKREPVSSVWFMDMESRNTRRITSGGNGDFFPVMSPDGKEIVFETLRQGNGGDIWTIDMAGKNYKRLTYGNYPELYPAYSPDGTKISYVGNENGIVDVWIMDRDGNHKKKVTKYLSKEAWASRWGSRFNHSDFLNAGYYHVSWHPDGTKLALTTWDIGKKESYLTLLDFGKDIGQVMDSLPDDDETLPDYTLIGEKDITGGGDWDDFGPSFSPDGNAIAFASNRKGNWDIWSIGADGEGLKQVTEGSTNELAPVFSPDGKEIAFIRQSSIVNRQYDIWVMNNDGSDVRQVTKDINVISYPAWNPDGKEIAFVAKGDKGPEIQLIPLNKGGQGVVTVSRVISNWDTDKPNPVMFPFSKEAGLEKFSPDKIAQKKKLVQEGKIERVELSHFTKGFDVLYPLNEFLYRVDYNTTGDKLIFESNRTENINIWSVNRDGTGLTRITKGDGTHLNPVFSPDNKKVVYARRILALIYYRQENYNIWLADMDTGEEIRINSEEQTDWNPVFSPDGKRIAYVTNRSGNFKNFNIWMLYVK